MGFYASVEAAALAWDITAASLRERQRKLNFPEVKFADLEQQLDALKYVSLCSSPQASQTHGVRVPMKAYTDNILCLYWKSGPMMVHADTEAATGIITSCMSLIQ
jgi:hypothetical protein